MSELPLALAEQRYAAPAQRLLLLLKRQGPKSLIELARWIGISKMGVYKHLVSM